MKNKSNQATIERPASKAKPSRGGRSAASKSAKAVSNAAQGSQPCYYPMWGRD